MESGSSTVNKATLAVYISTVSEYSYSVEIAKANLKLDLAKESKHCNDAQINYMVANGLSASDVSKVAGYKIPEGYVIPDELKEALNISDNGEEVVAYLIKVDAVDYRLDSTTSADFYSAKKFITSDGTVFMLPGMETECGDKTRQHYISDGRNGSYVTTGKSKLSVGDVNIYGDKVVAKETITAEKLMSETYSLKAED